MDEADARASGGSRSLTNEAIRLVYRIESRDLTLFQAAHELVAFSEELAKANPHLGVLTYSAASRMLLQSKAAQPGTAKTTTPWLTFRAMRENSLRRDLGGLEHVRVGCDLDTTTGKHREAGAH
ncbi:hypothetical protein [Brachybacterium sacelli]|uniref:Uncharacterized protein n=1 Tax=Brachybacterium sacelli TaxID=173364 RepID=A0ABS4X5P1_9MICO|nr:hypothetical protein [Brachybacterium sacelli]MBP2383755.1 hypothetical protein [Brachybacterium sacelli]